MNAQSKNMTILVADDDPDFLEQMTVQLRAAGYDVIPTGGQVEAEKVIAEAKPDLALVDLMMENEDGGFALCHHIKRTYPQTPIILVTAVASETGLEFDASTEEEKAWIKADAMLAKPVRFEQLQREITRLTEAT